MIGTEDMSTAAGMDISESFRAEDLSKTDFFDFVTAPDMGIGIGVGVDVGVGVGISLQQQQQQQQQHHQQHTQHSQHTHTQHTHSHNHQSTTSQTPQQAVCGGGARTSNGNSGSSMTHGGSAAVAGSGIVPVSNRNGSNTSNGGDPTLQGYEFWHQDKDNSRLDSSSIFEDLDRYCWQQQTVTASATTSVNTNNNNNVRCSNQPSPTSPQSHVHQQQQQQQQHQHQQHQQHQHQQQQQQQPNPSSSSSAAGSSSDTISSLDTTDGQIYTLTVLNGGEPWLKRETEQLPSTLDLDSLLGSFPGYIKSEYPYDDSGFSTDGKDVIVSGADANGLSSISSQSQPHGQTLPSLVTAISIAGGGGGGGGINELGQQLAQFQNNNNDWHMADHNAEAEQNSAESLLRSALQGKGYAKGLHMQNGLSLPVVKDDEMRRLLFTPDDAADALGFADSTLNAAQMFDDGQAMNHAAGGGGGAHMSSANHGQHGGNASIIVDDMFLSLENAFSDDFEKIKRLANEVQQFCSSGTPTPGDYGGSDVLMQISPSATATATTTTPQLQPLANAQQSQQQQQQQQQPPPPPQPLKPEVSTSTATTTVGNSGTSGRLGGVSKPKKQYKRSNSSANNNNNPNVANNNNSSGGGGNGNGVLGVVIGNGGSSSSSGSASSSSNSPPANCSASGSSASSGGGSQRKERSLHYCSICSKGFKDKYSVNVHIRTHTGEKPFACSLCGKSFRQKAHLAKHYQTHMTQKNNGSLIKGSSSKHQRGGGGSSNSAASLAQQQRQLSSAVASAVGSPSLMSAGVVLSGPNASPSVLPPANGLLTNR